MIGIHTNTKQVSDQDSNPYSQFTIFGNDYDTADGTCIRDYVHVQDIAQAHIQVTAAMQDNKLRIYNVGTGKGSSVLDLISALNGTLLAKNILPIRYQIGPRRSGDLDVCYADTKKIASDVGFQAEYDIHQMCKDGLNQIGL